MDEPITQLTEPTLTDIARLVARRDELEAGLPMYDAQYMQHAEAYARVMNELYDINHKLKEVGV
ncbi:hypothetical protein AVU90_gp55 [Enterococcus phage IME-EFm5]|uniref:Uncharacterized protein n=1 Tax=Enterococcus phage IME-EFm5 TaxID=1718158 RepID=A0A0M5M1E3_9CAUD|nr:hypothetical protein AVU90_gp55 [Enterococcus phage IME-EFm5]ALF02024.1 hypothetical protein EFm5_55 [Enterococcus phage IME-EFm5]